MKDLFFFPFLLPLWFFPISTDWGCQNSSGYQTRRLRKSSRSDVNERTIRVKVRVWMKFEQDLDHLEEGFSRGYKTGGENHLGSVFPLHYYSRLPSILPISGRTCSHPSFWWFTYISLIFQPHNKKLSTLAIEVTHSDNCVQVVDREHGLLASFVGFWVTNCLKSFPGTHLTLYLIPPKKGEVSSSC